jgi:hypothetical protein
MALTLTGTQLAPDTWEFTVTGVDATATDEFVISYGDGTAPVTTPVDPSGTTVVSHTYTDPGFHTYTVRVTADKTAFASTLQQLNDLFPGSLSDIAAEPALASLGDISATSETVSMLITVNVGPATIHATVVPGDPIPVVQLDAWVGDYQDVAQWTISRDYAGGSLLIWSSNQAQQAVSIIDELAPLNVPVIYRLTVRYKNNTTAIVFSNTVIITGTVGCYLTNPATGFTMRIPTLRTWPEREWAERRSVLEILGRADPVTLSDVHTWPAGVWTIHTTTDEETATMIGLLRARIVVLRTQPDSSIASVTASVGRITEQRHTSRGGDQRRNIETEIQEIAPLPATALPLGADLQGLHELVPTTLYDIFQLRATLLQLSQVDTSHAPATL